MKYVGKRLRVEGGSRFKDGGHLVYSSHRGEVGGCRLKMVFNASHLPECTYTTVYTLYSQLKTREVFAISLRTRETNVRHVDLDAICILLPFNPSPPCAPSPQLLDQFP